MKQQESTRKEVGEEDNIYSENDDEESSSEDEDEGEISSDDREDEESSSDDEEETNMSCERRNNDKEYKDSDGGKDEPDAVKKRRIDEVENDDETISAIFDKIAKGSYDANKIKKGNKKRRRDFWKERKVWCPKSNQMHKDQERTSSMDQESKDEPAPRSSTRGDCWMGTTEALGRLTKHNKEDLNSEDEWLILKVPKKAKGKIFFADYCGGDSEDEFHWLEGPYL